MYNIITILINYNIKLLNNTLNYKFIHYLDLLNTFIRIFTPRINNTR